MTEVALLLCLSLSTPDTTKTDYFIERNDSTGQYRILADDFPGTHNPPTVIYEGDSATVMSEFWRLRRIEIDMEKRSEAVKKERVRKQAIENAWRRVKP